MIRMIRMIRMTRMARMARMARMIPPGRPILVPAVAAMLAASFVPSTRADDIRLRASARLPAGAEHVRLADIAEIEGPDAERFADLVVAAVHRTDAVTELSVRDVRAALDAAGVHWGRINLTGNKVAIRPPARSAAAAPRPMTGASLLADPHDRGEAGQRLPETVMASALLDRPTLRGTIARRFLSDLGVQPDRLRLAFDAAAAEALDDPDDGVTWEIRLEGNAWSDRVTVTVRAWREGRITEGTHVAVRPQLLTTTAVLVRDVGREELLTRADVTAEDAWLPPSQASLVAGIDEVEGRFSRKPLGAGATLRRPLLRSPTLVDRGDRVVVRCLIGGIVLSLQAEARADGAAGETIEFRKLGERSTFLATVTERGEAVFDVGGS